METYLQCPSGPLTRYPSVQADRARLRTYDHWHIDVAEPWEIRFWTREFDCDESTLRRAVNAAGSVAGSVRFYLATH
jgi:uncharacterized protein DUF3606